MTTLLATFTTGAAAQAAAAALRERGLADVNVGVNPGGVDAIIGLGADVDNFRQQVLIVSTIGGTVTFAALAGFLGLVAAAFPEFRNMGMPGDALGALGITATFIIAGVVLGFSAGFLAGIPLSIFLSSAAAQAAADGYGTPRPLVTVAVNDRHSDDIACATLREFGPFEISRRRG
jgi:hypothetical protein